MASRKVTITLPEELVAELTAAATADGVPVSRLIADATAHALRIRIGKEAVAAWQVENGAFTQEEIAAARAEAAAADAQLLRSLDEERRGVA